LPKSLDEMQVFLRPLVTDAKDAGDDPHAGLRRAKGYELEASCGVASEPHNR
jgi:hypothetical protein